jgi:hypothetical protein
MWVTRQFTPPITSKFGFSETRPLVRGILVFWFLLAIPWSPVALLSGMAFDGGDRWQAYLFVCSMWLYPVTVSTATLCRKKLPILVLLPLLNVVGVWIAN